MMTPANTAALVGLPIAIGGRLFTRRQGRVEIYCRVGARAQRPLEQFLDGVGEPRAAISNRKA